MTALSCALGHLTDFPPLIYGLPDAETSAAGDRGEVILAGCTPDVPKTLACPRCGAPVARGSDWGSGPRDGAGAEPRKG
jgi:hypothetical protein